LQVCKLIKIGNKRLFILACFVLFGESLLVSQSVEMPKMPEMPDITVDIEMPEITNPTIGNGFYYPTVPSIKTRSDEKTKKITDDTTTTTQVLTDATTGEDLIKAFLNSSSTLTANDISTLYDSGLFSSLSGLTGTSTASVSNSSTNLLLQQVLASLEELKAEQKKTSAADQKSLEQQQQDNETFKRREPSILRFSINGYSMNDSLTKVFFSEPEPDGSFLLTADRRYFTNQKTRTETFYVLFKAERNQGAATTYTVEPSVVQDSKNENSYIYKFCHLKNLSAEKTGNLVVLKQNGELNVDLLLDIDY